MSKYFCGNNVLFNTGGVFYAATPIEFAFRLC